MKWLSRLKPRERALASLTAAVALLCLFYRMALVPARERLEEVRREISVQTKQLAAHRRSITQRERVLELYQRNPQLTRKVGSDEEESSQLLSEVEAVARTAGVTVVNLKSRPVEVSGLAKWYRMDMEMEASLEDLTRFVHALEQSTQLLRVERLEVKPDDKRPGPHKCQVQISKVVIP